MASDSTPENIPPDKKAETLDDTKETPDSPKAENLTTRKTGWIHRKSIRSIIREMNEQDHAELVAISDKDDLFQPPNGEDIQLACITLTEAYTPSTVYLLYEAMTKLGGGDQNFAERVRAHIESSRKQGTSSGWSTLATIRRPGAFNLGGVSSPDVPEGVSGIFLSVSTPTPTLTILLANFAMEEGACNIADILRKNHTETLGEIRFIVRGKFSKLRSKIPWSRPRDYFAGRDISMSWQAKQDAVESAVSSHEVECSRWLREKFPGRFSLASTDEISQPRVRFLVTKIGAPLEVDSYQRTYLTVAGVGVDVLQDQWSGVNTKWLLEFTSHSKQANGNIMVMSARRSDLGSSTHSATDSLDTENNPTNWEISQKIRYVHANHITQWTILRLLQLYIVRLSVMRDTAATRKNKLRRPVKQARTLDEYIMRDGIDLDTICREVISLAEDKRNHAWHMAHFTRRQEMPEASQGQTLFSLILTRSGIAAKRLTASAAAITTGITASAELRQSISNARLQRTTLGLTIVALIVAFASLAVAWVTLKEAESSKKEPPPNVTVTIVDVPPPASSR